MATSLRRFRIISQTAEAAARALIGPGVWTINGGKESDPLGASPMNNSRHRPRKSGQPYKRRLLARSDLEKVIESALQEEFGFKSKGQPSREKAVYWIAAFRRSGRYPESTPRSGKWLIFVRDEDIDGVWEKIRRATEEGKLGDQSKVSTAKLNSYGKPGTKVICVYTYDWTDVGDVRKVREELRKLSVTQRIPYKADEDTLTGKYAIQGRKERISKYFE